VKTISIALLALVSAAADDWTDLVGDAGLERWKKPAKGWAVAGEVSLDGADGKKLAGKEGRGMTLLNFFNFMGLAAAQFATGFIVEAARGAGLSDAAAYAWMFGALALALSAALLAYLSSRDPPVTLPNPAG